MAFQSMDTTTNSIQPAMDAAVNVVLKSNFDAESIVCFKTLLKLLDNLIKQPDNPKVRTIKASNPTIQQKILQKQGLGVLRACGFQVFEETGEITLDPTGVNDSTKKQGELERIQLARRMIVQVLIHELKVDGAELPPMPTPPPTAPPASSFDVYQPQRYDGTSAAVGTNLGAPKGWKSHTELQLEALKQKQQQLEQTIAKPTHDRQWKAYRSGSSAIDTTTIAAVAPTTSDAALLAAQITKKQQERQAAETQGFTTKAMRDLEALKKSKVYSHAHLKIHFADGSVVAGNFGPRSKGSEVLKALQSEVLLPSVAKIPMELYTTPPRTVLDLTKTLQELQLVPAAKIHVKWKQSLPAATSTDKGWFLRPELFQETPTIDMPIAIPVAEAFKEGPGDTTGAGATAAAGGSANTAVKRKPTKAEKEAALLKRMMGQK